jgi:DHA1 family bicyclomycin/chloramphenicol resistance-like MFS transporter/DHA1 family 2-module integral membrane pump EmrD-like MFS transporter
MGKSHFFILILTTLLVAGLTAFSSDIYTPAYFNVPIEHIQRSITFFMLAVSISQLIYGPLSDGVGRRKALIAGLVIMLIGSNICYFALNINILLVGRFVQGLGAGACACLWRSIFRDSFNSVQIAKYGSYLGIMVTLMITSTPTLGGYLSNSFGWKASFLAIIIYTSMTFLVSVLGSRTINWDKYYSRIFL